MVFKLYGLPVLGLGQTGSLKDDGDQWYMDSGATDTAGGNYDTGQGVDEFGNYDTGQAVDQSGDNTGTVDDGSSTSDTSGSATENSDGSWSFTDDQGNYYYEDADGNTTVINPDGSGEAYLADGTVYKWDTDGNQITEDGNEGPTAPIGTAPGEDGITKTKVGNLAQSALNAATKAATTNPSAPKPTTPAVLPTNIKMAIAAKQNYPAATSSTIGGLSMGTIILLGATGAFLLLNKKKG